MPKGRTNNPNGRPTTPYRHKFYQLVEKKGLYEKAINVIAESLNDRKTRYEDAKWIIEQCIGKAPQPITGEGGGPVLVRVAYD